MDNFNYYDAPDHCQSSCGLGRYNDEIELYDIDENWTFTAKGVIGKLNYIVVKKYLIGSLKLDTFSITPEFDHFPVLIE